MVVSPEEGRLALGLARRPRFGRAAFRRMVPYGKILGIAVEIVAPARKSSDRSKLTGICVAPLRGSGPWRPMEMPASGSGVPEHGRVQ